MEDDMNMRDLIPWSRQNERGLSLYQPEERSPFASLHREMNRLFDDAMRGFDMPQMAAGLASTSWPRLETTENEHEVCILAELPGVDEKDVDLSIDNNVLRSEERRVGQECVSTCRSRG